MDPQHKMLLEAVYEAIEAAGNSYHELRGSETAVFVGQMTEDYRDILYHDMDNVSQYTATGASRAITANRISYFFDWHGASVNVDTACSSSLVALHQAVQTLRTGESNLAIAAGVNLILGPEMFIVESKLHMLSPTGRCRMWDAGADGYARGEGLAVVALKTLPQALADNDHIECIIRETGVNQDGRTVGLTVPSATAQAALIKSTYARCGLDPTKPQDRCQYFEAHGTGTTSGDPKEAQAIRDVFFPPGLIGDDDGDELRTEYNGAATGDADDPNDQILYVGSIKTVIGHTEGAAGLAGVLKASLALQNAQIPSNMHFQQLSPAVEPFYHPHLQVPTSLLPWPISAPGVPRRASINSFGFGGTNAHVIIESWDGETSADACGNYSIDAKNMVKSRHYDGYKTCGPFVLSAHSRTALAKAVLALSKRLKEPPNSITMEDLAWTLQSRRTEFPFKAAFSATSISKLIDKLDSFIEGFDANDTISVSPKFPLRVLGVFTGQGAQWHHMGAGLFEQSLVFRGTIQQLDVSLANLPDAPSISLANLMDSCGDESRVHEAQFSQPLTTALQIALVDLLRSVGVVLHAVVGHSSGEIAAAYASGYLSASDAIRVAYYRGLHSSRAKSSTNGKLGTMLAVGMSLNDATGFCQRSNFVGRISVAAHNSPSSVTLSGDSDAVLEAQAVLDQQGTFARVLKVNKAYHSHHMQPCVAAYLESLKQCAIQPLRTCVEGECSWYSSVYGLDGRSIHDPDGLSDRYWIENMIKPVLLQPAVERAVREEDRCFDIALEIGPHPTLQKPVTDTLRAVTSTSIPYFGVLSRGKADTVAFSDALGSIWTRVRTPPNAPSIINWQAARRALYGDELRQPRVLKSLPCYSWDHEKPSFFESSISNAWRMSTRAIHPTLGRVTQHGSSNSMAMVWRNILKLTELEWLRGHQFQNQVIFPAAGYVSMAIDAAKVLAETLEPKLPNPALLVELTDIRFHNAITLEETSSSGVEATLIMSVRHRDIARDVVTAEYTCYSGDASTRPDETIKRATTLNVSGKATITLRPRHEDRSGTLLFPARTAPKLPLTKVDTGRFYSWTSSIGLQYSGDFLLESIWRRRNLATVIAKDPMDGDDVSMHVHPAMLDASFQGIFAAHSFPGDGGIRASYIPSAVDRIRVDMTSTRPCHCQQSNSNGSSRRVLADCYVQHDSTASISGDIDLFCAECEHPIIQVEGIAVSRLGKPTSQDDRALFSRTVWDKDLQSAGIEAEPEQPGYQERRTKLNETCDRMAYFYIRQLCDQIPETEIPSMEWHFQCLMNWALRHIVPTVQSGHHTRVSCEWITDTHETIEAFSDQYADYVEVRLIRAVGQQLPSIMKNSISNSITNQASMLDTLMEDNMLPLLYHQAEGFHQANELVGRAVGQLAHRYPRMRILEIGGGTGAATGPILAHLNSHFSSYTFTDISPGFFRDAQSKFSSSPGAYKMNYAVLDIEQDVQSSGFGENNFDLVVASNVLHATRSLARTVANCRRLVKPSGFLIMDEVTSDTLYGPFIVSGLAGWWLGHKGDGRLHGPTVSEDRWDCVLKENGFSGVDHIIRDSKDSSTYLFSIIISQATDERVDLLRAPLGLSPFKKTVANSIVGSHRLNSLVIVAAKTGYVADMAKVISSLLQPFADNLVVLDGWAALESEASIEGANWNPIITPGSAVICLSELQDEDSTDLLNVSPERLHALQSLFRDTSHVFLATRGCHAENSMANMLVGLCRTVMCETPHLRVLHIDIDDASPARFPGPADLSEMFLRMVWLDHPDYNDILWSNETELSIRKGLLYIPRIKPDEHLNRRLASRTRVIEDGISPESVPSISSIEIAVDEAGKPLLREATAGAASTPANASNSEPTTHFVTCCSTLFPISISDSTAPIHIGLGSPVDKPGQFLVAEMPSNASSLYLTEDQTIACDTSRESLVLILSRIVAALQCESFVANITGTLWFHEAPTEIAEMISQIAKARGIDIFFSTSSMLPGPATYGAAAFIHPRSTQRVLQAIVPSNVQRLILGTTEDYEARSFQDAVLRSRLVAEKNVRCLWQDVDQIKTVPLALSRSKMRDIIVRESSLFSSNAGNFETSVEPSVVDVATISSIHGSHKITSIVDWDRATAMVTPYERSFSIRIQPLGSNDRQLFSSNKTFLLVGLAGEVGMSLVEWMAGAGARHFAIVSRKPHIEIEVLRHLERLGVIIQTWGLDIADKQALSQAHSEMVTLMPPIAGVANGAMVLKDRPFSRMTAEDFKVVLRPKVQGSQNLDSIFHSDSLEFFVFFASGTSVVGNAGQSNYSAANMFMVSLAEQRRRRGVAASVIYLGTLLGIGHVARLMLETGTGGKRTVESQLQRFSSLPLSEADLHTAFAEAVDSGHPESGKDPAIIIGLGDGKDAPWRSVPRFSYWLSHLSELKGSREGSIDDDGKTGFQDGRQLSIKQKVDAALNISTAEGTALLEEIFLQQLGVILQTPVTKIDKTAALVSLGIDSLVAAELRSWFLKGLGADVPILQILGGASSADICRLAITKIPESKIMEPSLDFTDDGSISGDGDKEEYNMSRSFRASGTTPPSPSQQGVPISRSMFPEPSPILRTGSSGLSYVRLGEMSTAQARLYFLHQYLEEKSAYNVGYVGKYRGNLDLDKLKNAVWDVCTVHESLRSCYFVDESSHKAMQAVLPNPRPEWKHIQIQEASEIRDEIDSQRRFVFDIEHGHVVKITVLSLSPVLHHIIFLHHHIALDGIGWFLFMTHLNKAYSGHKILPPLQQSIDMSAKELAQRGAAADVREELAFWGKMHQDAHEPLPLFAFAKIGNRRVLNRYETQTLDAELLPDLAKRIRQTAASLGVPAFHFYLSALAVFLKRCLSVNDFSIGIVDANRPDPEDASTMGYFLNLLPIRYRLSPEAHERAQFSDLVKESRNMVFAALSNARAPFDVILDHLQVSRAGSHHPLFQVALDYREGYLVEDKFGTGTIEWDHKHSITVRNPHDIFVNVTPASGSRTFIHWTTQKYMYSASDSRLMITWYTRILDALSREPSTSIAGCPIATETDLRQAIALGTGKSVEISSSWGEGTLIHQVERMARRYSESMAIIDENGTKLTYAQMMIRTETLARYLKQTIVDNGMDFDDYSIKEVVIGTIFNPMSDHVCCLLAILKLGLTCVGLDLRNPEERLSVMLLDCRPRVLVCNSTTKDQANRLAGPVAAVVLDIDKIADIDPKVYHLASEETENRSSLDQCAVILYTSGSTGVPKGVLLSHMNLHSHIKANTELFNIRHDDVILHQTSPGFDFSLDQIFHALGNGGTLIIVGKEGRGDPAHIAHLIHSHEVTFTVGCPSEYLGLLNYGFTTLRRCRKWRLAFSGGEKLTFQLRKGFQKLQLEGLQLMNVYGPTEVTIACARGVVPYRTDEDLVAQGDYLFPMPKYSILVVDDDMNLLPVGVPGEVLIAGEGVALGYLNRAAETERRFVEIVDPATSLSPRAIQRAESPGKATTRIYRSGDYGRLLEDSSINLLGRLEGSSQVKIRGMRVELDEVANVMIRESNGAVTAAAVSHRHSPADILVAFVVFDAEFPREKQLDLGQRLGTKLPLPSHMCPAITVPVTELPTNVNGKLDRGALDKLQIPTGVFIGRNDQETKTLTPLELSMKKIWREVLDRVHLEGETLISDIIIDADTDFFLIGGNSISAIKLRAVIKATFGVSISLPELFRMRTLASMSAGIQSLQNPNSAIAEGQTPRMDWTGEVAALFDGLSSITRHISPSPSSDTGTTVLLTGATGFLGTHILRRLVSDPRVSHVHCVAIRRGRRVSVTSPKIISHSGDLADPLLGLSQDVFTALATDVDLIIHNGAQVSFLQPYRADLRAPNALSTRILCTLGLRRGIPLHFVSSAAVAGVLLGSESRDRGRYPILGPISVAESLPEQQENFERDGYALSKWVSEALLQKVATECGLPVFIHRAASIVGDGAPKLDVVSILIGYSRVLGAVPVLESELGSKRVENDGRMQVVGAFDFVPVERVSEELVGAALESALVSASSSTGMRFIHHCSDDKILPQELQAYMETMDKRSYGKMAVGNWLDAAKVAGLNSVMYEYLHGILRDGKELYMPVLRK